MPSASVLEQKKQVVAQLSERLEKSIAGVVVEYKGINLVYGLSIDYLAYGGIDKQGSQRG